MSSSPQVPVDPSTVSGETKPLEMLGMVISILANIAEGGCFAAIFYSRWVYVIVTDTCLLAV